MSDFSIRLTETRVQSGLTQEQVGKLCDLPGRRIRCYENGEQEPTLSKAAPFARALGVSLDYLAGLQDDPTI